MAQIQVQKVSWWHERLADWMVANPHRTLKEAARDFNCSIGWISIVKNSDSFKEYWSKRTVEASERNDANTLIAKTAAVADLALDGLLEKLSAPGEILPYQALLETADTFMKRLGHGVKPATAGGGSPKVTVNIGLISPERLAAAREKMKQLHGISTTEPIQQIESEAHLLPPAGEE